MTVFFLVYFAVSLVLLCFLEVLRSVRIENLTKDEMDVFAFMEKRPVPFYTIFVLISPILAVYVIVMGILAIFSEASGK